jgi:hypothetical protein
MVVDSCLNPESKRPVAIEYFEEIGVSPSQVKLITATHWHDDHIRGLSELVTWAPGATFVWSNATRSKEFFSLVGSSELEPTAFSSGVGEFSRILSSRQQRIRGRLMSRGMEIATADRLLLRLAAVQRPKQVKVYALSPSSQTVTDCLKNLGALVQTEGEPVRRIPLTANEASIVLYVVGGNTSILLGGDLEQTTHTQTGWNAVAQCATIGPKAQLLKIPHHGAPNADADLIWQQLLVPKPIAGLTPYLAGKTPRPTAEDLERIKKRAEKLFVAGASAPATPARRENAVEKQMKQVASNRREFGSRLGHVRLRLRIGDDSSAIDCVTRWAAREYHAA